MTRILITGAAGDIGGRLRRQLAGVYPSLRLSDIRTIDNLGEGEEFVAADLRDPAAVREICRGVDGIVHLGGQSGEAEWDHILNTNIVATYNVFEAARREGVARIVFASSNHAVGYYRRDQTIPVDVTPLPDTYYGLSKAFGESLGALYARKHGLKAFCIRIGNAADQPVDKRRLSIWISDRDLAQLVRIGLDHPDVDFNIVYGGSDNARGWWDNQAAFDLGYRPQDKSEDYAETVLAKETSVPADAASEIYQGGTFVDM